MRLAEANGLAAGRRMRVDTTVVETNVHYPTDSSLLGDGVRVLIRTMKRIRKIAGQTGAKLCDRGRSVKLRVLARAARSKAKQSRDRLNRSWQAAQCDQPSGGTGEAFLQRNCLRNEAREASIVQQLVLEGLRQELDAMVPLVKQVMKQTRARIFRGDTHAEGKLLSVFVSSMSRSFERASSRQAERGRQDGEAAGGRESDRD